MICFARRDACVYKIPESVLVIIYTSQLEVLLLQRADHPGFWQSVTGSKDSLTESLVDTVRREVYEETGLDVTQYHLTNWNLAHEYEIFPHWRQRYAPGVMHNTEHVFGVELPARQAIRIEPREHIDYMWLPWQEAAEKCFSLSNAESIRLLPQHLDPSVLSG